MSPNGGAPLEIGVCAPPERAADAAKAGFDFIEPSLASLAGMGDAEFVSARRGIDDAGIPARATNGMFPSELRLTGDGASLAEALEYIRRAFSRAAALGVEVCVFGSGGARRVPDGFPAERAWRQIADLLRGMQPVAAEFGIRVAIEPLRRAECNLINLVTEATAISAILGLPNVGALADTHHMNCVGEPLESLTLAGALLRHVHVSRSFGDDGGRVFPAMGDGEDYPALFRALAGAGYAGRVSVEAGCTDFSRDGAAAALALREASRAALSPA